MAYGDFKDLNRGTAADKVLCDKALILLKIQKSIDTNMDLLQCSINVLIENLLVAVLKIKIFLIKN